MVKICVSGSRGKMGLRIIALAKQDRDLQVTGEFDIGTDPEPAVKLCDCLIEFTTPQATIEHLALCVRLKKSIVIGTTGISDADKEKIISASKAIPVVFSPNMSIGVNVMFKVARDITKSLGPGYTIDIVEAHHVHKKDAPSGTAKELSRVISEVREGAQIPIKSIREDEIIGDHTVTFESPVDTIRLTHSAKTRDMFAKGAFEAAKFVAQRPAGLYTMKEVLGI